MGDRVRITDVAPRDGLQNESGMVPTSEKARLVEAISCTGVEEVEVTSFVSPAWVPQLGDAAALCDLIAPAKPPGVVYSALVPNEKGMERLLEVNERSLREHGRRAIDKVAVFTSASETFSRRNTNASIGESIERFVPVRAMASDAGLSMRGYLSCVIACPFEGPIEPDVIAKWALTLAEIGIEEVDLGDTIGAATPESMSRMLDRVMARWTDEQMSSATLTVHLHDTFGRAGECIRWALAAGIRSFDGSVAGLGGCPYASTPGKRAPGNIATHTLVRVIEQAGYETGVDQAALGAAAGVAESIVAGAREAGS